MRAELARLCDLSRARVSQIMNLLRLPAKVREGLLQLPDGERRYFTERKLSRVLVLASARQQLEAFERLRRLAP